MIKISHKKVRYLAVIVLLVLFYKLGFLAPLEGLLSRFLNPVLHKVQLSSSAISQKYKEQTSKTNFAQTITDQQTEINRLLVENAELKIVKEENQAMREFLNFFSNSEYEKVMAGVISRGGITDSANRIEFINIDKGSADGVYSGLAVINEQGVIIGKVANVKEKISEVYLVLNSSCRLAATILGEEKTSGIVEGDLGLTMLMNFIPQSKTVKKGDVVISSGLEESIPRGLVMGQVSELIKENNDLWQTAILETSVNLDELVLVAVVIP